MIDTPRASRSAAKTVPLRTLFDRTPPHDPESEAGLLGALLIDPSIADDVLQWVPSGDSFYLAAHAVIFDAIIEACEHRQSCDLIQLKEKLEGKAQLNEVGGVAYLARIVEDTPSAAAGVHYAKTVHDKARLRAIIAASEQAMYDAYHAGELGEGGAEQVAEKSERAMLQAASSPATVTVTHLRDLTPAVCESLRDTTALAGITSGFRDYDEQTGGLMPGDVTIWGARPSMGKTMCALEVALRTSMCSNPVMFGSAEMGDVAIATRLLCRLARLPSLELRKRGSTPEEDARIDAAKRTLDGLPFVIDDTPGASVDQLRASVRRQVKTFGVRLLVVDYLQLLRAPKRDRFGKTDRVGYISNTIKAMARENNIPVLCLAQLNRQVEGRDVKRPGLADLRDSGEIEQDADVVALLHREEYYHKGDQAWAREHPEQVGKAELIVAKQRNGPTGIVELKWDAGSMAFADWPQRFGVEYGAEKASA